MQGRPGRLDQEEQVARPDVLTFPEIDLRQLSADLGFHPHVLDLTCFVGMAGLFIAGLAWRLRSCSLIPTHDPRLGEALAFENM